MAMATLDTTFAALADPTRRAILRRLAEGEATVSTRVSMSLPPLLVAVIWILNTPMDVVEPPIAPVVVLNVSPGGRFFALNAVGVLLAVIEYEKVVP